MPHDVCDTCEGHKNAILELHWTTDGERVITASPDKTIRAWDSKTGEQVKKMTEHDNFVNSCCPLKQGPPLLVSGSDDGSAKVHLAPLSPPWSVRSKLAYSLDSPGVSLDNQE